MANQSPVFTAPEYLRQPENATTVASDSQEAYQANAQTAPSGFVSGMGDALSRQQEQDALNTHSANEPNIHSVNDPNTHYADKSERVGVNFENKQENQADKNLSGSLKDENAHSTNKPIKNICVDNTIGRSWAKDWSIFNANEDAHTSTKLGRKRPDVQQKIIDIAIENGINPRLMLAFADIETGGKFKPDDENRDTHASGLFQFMPANWEKYGLGKNGEYRFDIEKNTLAGIQMLKENIDYFHNNIDNSREPTVAELYLMHQQGRAGFERLYKNPDELATKARKSTKAIELNVNEKEIGKHYSKVTSKEFIEHWNNKVNRRAKDFY